MEDQEYISEDDYAYLRLCGEPTIIDGLKFARDLLLVNGLFQVVVQYCALPEFARHALSLLLGSFLLYNAVGFAFLWTAALTVGSYCVLMALTLVARARRGLITSALVLAFLLQAEHLAVDALLWQRIRGIQMIATMKVISVAMDLDRGLARDAPSPAAYAGYVMSPATCVLGPWVSYRRHAQSLGRQYLDRSWLLAVLRDAVLALLFLFLSNCLVPWYLSEDSAAWALAYRDAQSFRASHYFVSLMSQSALLAGGHSEVGEWSATVCRPLRIELPRSLVQVVVYWNIPMHQWLKTYVFKVCQPYGKFAAVFATYAVSSLLHGLNFQLSAALLSIGAFSYVEYKIRAKLAVVLNACVLVSPCPRSCVHGHSAWAPRTILTNAAMSLLAIWHLAYLGVMFGASFAQQESGYSYSHTLSKWAELGFSSHLIAAITYLMYLLL